MGPNVVDRMIDLLGRQIASPVQFVKGLHTLYDAGCRVFVEVGPKRALHGFVEEVLGEDPEVVALFSNHPKQGDVMAFNQALCGLYAAGLGVGASASCHPVPTTPPRPPTPGSADRRRRRRQLAPEPPWSPASVDAGRRHLRGAREDVRRRPRPGQPAPRSGAEHDSARRTGGRDRGRPGPSRRRAGLR